MIFESNIRYRLLSVVLLVTMLMSALMQVGWTHPDSDASSAELINIGDRDFLSANYSSAYENYSMASRRNDKAGHYRMAMLLYFGLGTPQNTDNALELLVESAKDGYVPAQIISGIFDKYDLDKMLRYIVDTHYDWLKVSLADK